MRAASANTAPGAEFIKAFDTLRAMAALHGYACGSTHEGWIVVRRFGMSAVFDTVGDASAWLERRVGGAS